MSKRKLYTSSSTTYDDDGYYDKDKRSRCNKNDSDSSFKTSMPGHPSSISLLDLPTEILVQIADRLRPEDYLAIKFVCRRLDAVTKNEDGSATKRVKVMFCMPLYDHPDPPVYSTIMAALEAGLSDAVVLKRLTCSGCGDLFATWDGTVGFEDDQFDRTNALRKCMECASRLQNDYEDCDYKKIFMLNEQAYIRCYNCQKFRPMKESLQNLDIEEQFGERLLEALDNYYDLRSNIWHCRDCIKVAAWHDVDEMDFVKLQG